jgi:hypothetical protein
LPARSWPHLQAPDNVAAINLIGVQPFAYERMPNLAYAKARFGKPEGAFQGSLAIHRGIVCSILSMDKRAEEAD